MPEARENAGDQVAVGLVLHLIGWDIAANFFDQSKGGSKSHANTDCLRLSGFNRSIMGVKWLTLKHN